MLKSGSLFVLLLLFPVTVLGADEGKGEKQDQRQEALKKVQDTVPAIIRECVTNPLHGGASVLAPCQPLRQLLETLCPMISSKPEVYSEIINVFVKIEKECGQALAEIKPHDLGYAPLLAGRAIALSRIGSLQYRYKQDKMGRDSFERLVELAPGVLKLVLTDELFRKLANNWCGRAVAKLSLIYQNEAGTAEQKLPKVLRCLYIAYRFGCKESKCKLNAANDETLRATNSDADFLGFVKLIEEQESNLGCDAAYQLAQAFRVSEENGSDLYFSYKWLVKAACGKNEVAKNQVIQSLSQYGKYGSDTAHNSVKSRFLKEYNGNRTLGVAQSSQLEEEYQQHDKSVDVAVYCLLTDLINETEAQGRSYLHGQRCLISPVVCESVTDDKPMSWHVENLKQRLPLVAKHGLPLAKPIAEYKPIPHHLEEWWVESQRPVESEGFSYMPVYCDTSFLLPDYKQD